jgi:2-polyprenyl-3-methyl-5-hydroxy-6-metoxy-1,4-benzoquinol methylase
MIPGKQRYIGWDYPGSERFEALVFERYRLETARDPAALLEATSRWATPAIYAKWLAAYRKNDGSFLDHVVWGADRDLGGGHYLFGAMDDRFATNAARVFVAGGLDVAHHVVGKRVCVIGAWDGTECLLLRALGAASVDAVDEVPAFCEMAKAQYAAWEIPGNVLSQSLYEIDVEAAWQMYDLVYVPGVLYHLTDLPTALVILWSMLRPGGTLAFESIADARGPCSARYLGASVPGWNWWSPTPECYEAAMRDCGFTGRTVEYTRGRGWWVGSRNTAPAALMTGAAGFSRPDILRSIARLT